MNCQIVTATKADEEILKNLFQFYIYDFSEFMNLDVEANGRYREYSLDGENLSPYFIKNDTKYIGFVLVDKDETSNCILEFFIMKKYRREGIGKSAAKEIFRLHKGNWVVHQISANKPAQAFWRNVIAEFTEGNFIEGEEEGKVVQKFTS